MHIRKTILITTLLMPALGFAGENQTAKKSALPHASYKKGQMVIIGDHNGSLAITKTPEPGSNIYVVEQYSVESYPSVGYTKRTVVASRKGDLRIFGHPLFTKTVIIHEVQGEQPQGSKILAPGGPVMNVMHPTRSGIAMIAIVAGGLAGIWWKMISRIKELEEAQKKP